MIKWRATTFTRFGRTVYAIGNNEQSARLMGLPVGRTRIIVYSFSGFCSALAGIIFSISLLAGCRSG
jgi:simple sugar transport system permease protein